MCTTFVNIQELCILSTQCVSECHVILTINGDCFSWKAWYLVGVCNGDAVCLL